MGEGSRSIEQAFSPNSNTLNLLRLVLATMVILSHSIAFGGYASEYILGKTTVGTIAVYGFFGISGFLIARSAEGSGLGHYLWSRFLRIFPGFWVAIILTAFFFGVIAWRHDSSSTSCSLSCYLRAPSGGFGYVFHNWWLRINQTTISNTPKNWLGGFSNASLWTLFYEFLCYLLLAAMSALGMFRRRTTVLVFAVAVWMAEIVITAVPSLNAQFNFLSNWDVTKMLTFVPVFLTGSLIWLYREQVPDSGWIALGCVVAFAISLVIPVGNRIPSYTLTSSDLLAPALAYPLLWLGFHLPWHWLGAKNDYSYGVYIYAAPVAQILTIYGAYRWGYLPYTVLTIALVIPFAIASWWFVEKPAQSLKRLRIKVAI